MRCRSIIRNCRASMDGTKLASSRPSCRYSAIRFASRPSLFRPESAFTCAGFTSKRFKTLVFKNVPDRTPIYAGRFHCDLGNNLLEPDSHSNQIIAERAVSLPHCLAVAANRRQYADDDRVFVDVYAAAAAVCFVHFHRLLPQDEER